MSFQEVLSTIKSWPLEEQYRLFYELDALLPPEIDAELFAEVERRSDLCDQGKMSAAPWSEVRDRARRAAGLEPLSE